MPESGPAGAPDAYVFAFFCGMMVLQLLWVKFMVPETKGVPLEEIQQRLTGSPLSGHVSPGAVSAAPVPEGESL